VLDGAGLGHFHHPSTRTDTCSGTIPKMGRLLVCVVLKNIAISVTRKLIVLYLPDAERTQGSKTNRSRDRELHSAQPS